ncbi:MAG: carbon starvation CstA family protein [Flavobacteriales bacterium]
MVALSVLDLLILTIFFVVARSLRVRFGYHGFTLQGMTLSWSWIIYGFVLSVLPVWLLLMLRDYLSMFIKIGTIVYLVIGILIIVASYI